MGELYVGLMSGTSMDGVDAVLVDFSASRPRLVASHSKAMPAELREALVRLAANGSPHPIECLGELDYHIGALFADATTELLEHSGTAGAAVVAVGSHGQTLYHRPQGPAPFTLQIGNANLIAERTGITTVADFRRRDMAAGGQGAPLVPAFHAALARTGETTRAILNVGGIANLTLLPAEEGTPVTGFDTGPGNVLMDEWVRLKRNQPYDRDGLWAASGSVGTPLLERLLADPYFSAPAPKSTGREYFNLDWLERHLAGEGATEVQATLCELTAVSVSRALDARIPGGGELFVCGGGAGNRHLMGRLGDLLPNWDVSDTRALGLHPQWVEATAFAWLARQTLQGASGNLPAVTGARHPVVLGAIYPGGPSAP